MTYKWGLRFVVPLLLLYAMLFRVDTKEVALIYRFGKLIRIEDAGLHFKLPYPIETEERLATKKEHFIDLGERQLLTGDVNLVSAHLVVQYIIADPIKYSLANGQPDQTLQALLQHGLTSTIGQSYVDEISFLDRGLIQRQIKENTQKQLDILDIGIQVEAVELKALAPPTAVEAAYNDISVARGEVETMIHAAQTYAFTTEPQARGIASGIIEEAKEESANVLARAHSDTERFQQLLPLWKQNSAMLQQTLKAESWERVTPQLKTYYLHSEDVLFLPEHR